MDYPDKFIRGIPNSNFVVEEGAVSCSLFDFKDTLRNDNHLALSINWYDDKGALTHIMEQKKKDDATKYQFEAGAAIIDRSLADFLKNRMNNVFDYEREAIEDINKYHGNLLMQNENGVTKTVFRHNKKIIQAHLALGSEIIPREQK